MSAWQPVLAGTWTRSVHRVNPRGLWGQLLQAASSAQALGNTRVQQGQACFVSSWSFSPLKARAGSRNMAQLPVLPSLSSSKILRTSAVAKTGAKQDPMPKPSLWAWSRLSPHAWLAYCSFFTRLPNCLKQQVIEGMVLRLFIICES